MRQNTTLKELRKTPLNKLFNIPDEDETFTDLEAETAKRGNVTPNSIQDVLFANTDIEILADKPFQNGPHSRRIWEQAFSNFHQDHRTEDDIDITVKHNNHTPGPRTYVSYAIQRKEVELTDGTTLENIYRLTLNRSAGNPERELIVKINP